jgi:hypothetical protein
MVDSRKSFQLFLTPIAQISLDQRCIHMTPKFDYLQLAMTLIKYSSTFSCKMTPERQAETRSLSKPYKLGYSLKVLVMDLQALFWWRVQQRRCP